MVGDNIRPLFFLRVRDREGKKIFRETQVKNTMVRPKNTTVRRRAHRVTVVIYFHVPFKVI